MRIANVAGRLAVADEAGDWIDVAKASNDRFSPDPQAVYDRWQEFTDWVAAGLPESEPVTGPLGTPVPAPRQLIAIGLNYREHAKESNLDVPEHPVVFAKFSRP